MAIPVRSTRTNPPSASIFRGSARSVAVVHHSALPLSAGWCHPNGIGQMTDVDRCWAEFGPMRPRLARNRAVLLRHRPSCAPEVVPISKAGWPKRLAARDEIATNWSLVEVGSSLVKSPPGLARPEASLAMCQPNPVDIPRSPQIWPSSDHNSGISAESGRVRPNLVWIRRCLARRESCYGTLKPPKAGTYATRGGILAIPAISEIEKVSSDFGGRSWEMYLAKFGPRLHRSMDLHNASPVGQAWPSPCRVLPKWPVLLLSNIGGNLAKRWSLLGQPWPNSADVLPRARRAASPHR